MTTENLPDDPMDPRLRVLSERPQNAETPLTEASGAVTPIDLFFRRNRFSHPSLRAEDWTLEVGGAVERPFYLTYQDLLALPAVTIGMTLECAGNGRTAFSPPAEGEPWEYGAVSTAEWTGAPLALLLERAGVHADAVEVLAEGSDHGVPEAGWGDVPFARGLPLEKALHPDTLVAYAMNSRPLPRAHGSPARLLVPGWYGMASVKWLRRLTAITEPFTGYFQKERYVFEAPGGRVTGPVTEVAVRSLVVSPRDGDHIAPGRLRISGLAWSGAGEIDHVDITVDGGASWEPATLIGEARRYAWREWECVCEVGPGECVVMSRATDRLGNTQPEEAAWNRLGYGNNAVQRVRVWAG